jgi:2-amino-4-hydroxy-6-hydroxymethyldihydropteridine diphosphokinase
MILIALGSNITGPWGSPHQTVLRAVEEMQQHNISILKVSSLIETAPFGVTNQPNFVNAVAKIRTDLSPEVLMQTLHAIESIAGRKRLERWGPRTLDLDLLDYNGLIKKPSNNALETLELPHPGIEERTFVLQPIAEIAPRWKHPVTHQSALLTLRQLNRLNGN